MKTLKNADIESVRIADLKPGMILVNGIVKNIDVTGKVSEPIAWITFFGGAEAYIEGDRHINVIGKVDDTLLANMMGA